MLKKVYNTLDLIKIPFKCSKTYTSLLFLKNLLDGIVPNLEVIVIAKFLDTVLNVIKGKQQFTNVLIPGTLLILLIAYQWLSTEFIKFIEIKLVFAMRGKFRLTITEKRAKLSYKHIENQDTWDLISRISKEPEYKFKEAYVNLLGLISMIIRIIGLLFILGSKIWWAAIIIIIATIPLVKLSLKSGEETYEANKELSKYERKYEYLGEVLTGREAILERTLFSYSEKLNKKWIEAYETARKIRFKTSLKWFVKLKINSVITSFILMGIVVILINPVLNGTLSIGFFIGIVNATFALVNMTSWNLTNYVDTLAESREYLKDLKEFFNLEESEGALDLPSNKKIELESLEFKKVYFKYPGTDKYVLKDMSFKIEKGIHYSFVGSNGSGKTTITKLITGLYDEFEGEILINGKSIKNYNLSDLKAISSVVYQDFAKYFITVKDNISIGNINEFNESTQEEKIKKAIKIMGLEAAIEKLPNKLDTPLGKIKECGQDLSNGEWQRLAMARAIVNPASLKILDEPTAALDPISESCIYEEFEKIDKNSTTIFISHRLGSTKLAKEIFVIEEGTIVEKGSHDELMAKKGLYANMYESQRSWYL